MSCYINEAANQEPELLRALGKKQTAELFQNIPSRARLAGQLDIPSARSEPEVLSFLKALAGKNRPVSEMISFLGAGAYHHYVPAVIAEISGRSEFYTAYTPYQPEISQGILQAIFEYQTMICQLTGLDISNASLYDGATALAEAVHMAQMATGRTEILTEPYVHPHYLEVLKTYGHKFSAPEILPGKFLYAEQIKKMISGQTAAVILPEPNFLGQVYSSGQLREIAELAAKSGAVVISVFNPISLGLLEAPGNNGADIAVGEGQPLGNHLNFGGPYLGLMAARTKMARLMPGRIVGQTEDSQGRRGFVLTLQTREQHIRREKATSNICSNQALCALAAVVYLSWLGPRGLRRVAELALERAVYAAEKFSGLKNFKVLKDGPFFNEIILQTPDDAGEIQKKLLKKNILAGVNLGNYYPGMKNCLLLAFTEQNTFPQIDALVEALENA